MKCFGLTHVANMLRSRMQRQSLRTNLILYILLPVNLILALLALLSISWLERTLENQLQREVELIARAITGPVQEALVQRQEEILQQTLDSVFSIRRVYGIFVFDESGNELWAKGNIPYRTTEDLQERSQEQKLEAKYEKSFNVEVFSYFVPLYGPNGDNLGFLQITRQKSEIERVLSHSRYRAGLIILSLSAMFTVIIYFTHKLIIERPLTSLIDGMVQVGQGKLNYRSIIDGPREINALSSAFNRMMDNIELYRSQVSKQRSQQSKLQTQLYQAEKLAAVGQLAAGVAHELGTPLSVIAGKSQRALRKLSSGGDWQSEDYFADIKEEADKMQSIIRQFLDFTQDRSNSRRKDVSMYTLMDSLRRTFDELSQSKPVHFISHDAPKDHVFFFDPIQIQQVLLNLLRNAHNAVSENGSLALSWQVESQTLRVIVEDSGPGVTPELQDKIFEPFFTTKNSGHGIGLGLSVSLAIVHQYNGRIEVAQSAQYGGAKFLVELPIDDIKRG